MRQKIIWAAVILILASCSHDGPDRLSWEQSRQERVVEPRKLTGKKSTQQKETETK